MAVLTRVSGAEFLWKWGYLCPDHFTQNPHRGGWVYPQGHIDNKVIDFVHSTPPQLDFWSCSNRVCLLYYPEQIQHAPSKLFGRNWLVFPMTMSIEWNNSMNGLLQHCACISWSTHIKTKACFMGTLAFFYGFNTHTPNLVPCNRWTVCKSPRA